MSSVVDRLIKKGCISPPSWLSSNVMFEAITGSVAFGVSTDTSDMDVVGFCIPPKDAVFPHLAGEIEGFGRQRKRFKCYQKHHIDPDDNSGKIYDLTIYNIVHFFHLCMENNPNMVATLFSPQDCILHSTKVFNMIRDKRRLFLHKGAWHRFKGYAYNQLHKIKTKNPGPDSKRVEIIEKFGYDVKFGYHVVRLFYEIEQILETGDLDLRRNSDHLKAIRRGEVSEEELTSWATEKEKSLERLYETSTLRYGPDEDAIKQLLLECLEEHWGSLRSVITLPTAPLAVLREVADILYRNRELLE